MGTDLYRVVMTARGTHASEAVRRAATWMFWKNGGLDDFLHDEPGRGRGQEIAAGALRLFHDAGLDLAKVRMWGDAARIEAALPVGELRSWLAARQIPGAPQGIT